MRSGPVTPWWSRRASSDEPRGRCPGGAVEIRASWRRPRRCPGSRLHWLWLGRSTSAVADRRAHRCPLHARRGLRLLAGARLRVLDHPADRSRQPGRCSDPGPLRGRGSFVGDRGHRAPFRHARGARRRSPRPLAASGARSPSGSHESGLARPAPAGSGSRTGYWASSPPSHPTSPTVRHARP